MIAGHFGFAAAVKSRETATPLWALMLATVWLDIVFVPLLLTHVETLVAATPGVQVRGYGTNIIHADYTHSLVGALLLSALAGGVAGWAWGRRSGLVIGAVAFSHWFWDLLVHRADMPWLPANAGNLPRLGFGLWRWPTITAGLELLLVVVGAVLYGRAALKASRATGRRPVLAWLAAALALGFGVLVLELDLHGPA